MNSELVKLSDKLVEQIEIDKWKEYHFQKPTVEYIIEKTSKIKLAHKRPLCGRKRKFSEVETISQNIETLSIK